MRFSRRRPLGMGLLAATVLVACQQPLADIQLKDRHASPSPRPTARPSGGASAASAGSPRPDSPPETLSSPPSGLTSEHQALRSVVVDGLAAIAQVGFLQARSAMDPVTGADLIGKARLPGIISNNGGAIISNNGAGYRVTAVEGTIGAEAEPDETLVADRLWVDGRATRQFSKASGDYVRRVEFIDGRPRYELRQTILTRHAGGQAQRQRQAITTLYADGRYRSGYEVLEDLDPTGAITALSLEKGQYRDASADLGLDIGAFNIDLQTGTGRFRYDYGDSGLSEVGTLEGVAVDADGRVELAYNDPLEHYDGTSELARKGTTIADKRRSRANAAVVRTYRFKDGSLLRFDHEEGGKRLGELLVNDKAEARAELEQRPDGTMLTRLYFPEEPTKALVVGYGTLEAAPTPSPTPPVLRVTTVAGGEAGFADGPGASARFNGVRAIVRSRVTPNRFYVADSLNHRIRTVTFDATGRATVGTYAGDGTAGATDGAAGTARFDKPYGLAVGPDDTLYVSEEGGGRLRVISTAGTVSTLAGGGRGSFSDGVDGFSLPAGLALDADGSLLVADYGHQRVRRVTASGVVSTVAGDGTEGLVDGPAASARFKGPVAVALQDGAVLVADSGNRRIRAIAGGQVSTRAGSGDPAATARNAFTDGAALSGGFNAPFAIAPGNDGQSLFVGSIDLRRLADGQLRTVAGATRSGEADGPVREASFRRIFGLAMSADGALVVGHDSRIRLVPTR